MFRKECGEADGTIIVADFFEIDPQHQACAGSRSCQRNVERQPARHQLENLEGIALGPRGNLITNADQVFRFEAESSVRSRGGTGETAVRRVKLVGWRGSRDRAPDGSVFISERGDPENLVTGGHRVRKVSPTGSFAP